LPDAQSAQLLEWECDEPPETREAKVDITRSTFPDPHSGHFASETLLRLINNSNRFLHGLQSNS